MVKSQFSRRRGFAAPLVPRECAASRLGPYHPPTRRLLIASCFLGEPNFVRAAPLRQRWAPGMGLDPAHGGTSKRDVRRREALTGTRLTAAGVVRGDEEIARFNHLAEVGTREGNGLDAAAIERAVRANEEDARFGKQRRLLDPDQGLAA